MFMKGCYILLSKTHINVTLYAIATYHTKYTLLNDEYWVKLLYSAFVIIIFPKDIFGIQNRKKYVDVY